ncbi:DA1-related 5 [Spatholobus suberectus]|nr:DA1-related 5 [Spatholobus suberectus]
MSILAEAAAGVASGELLKAILETIDKAVMFKPTLEGLRSTLSRIAPAMKDIEQLNIKLGHPKEELESLIRQMKEGTELVYKCSQFRKLNCLAKVHYQRRLEALQESLLRFFHLDMIAYAVRDLRRSYFILEEIIDRPSPQLVHLPILFLCFAIRILSPLM